MLYNLVKELSPWKSEFMILSVLCVVVVLMP